MAGNYKSRWNRFGTGNLENECWRNGFRFSLVR